MKFVVLLLQINFVSYPFCSDWIFMSCMCAVIGCFNIHFSLYTVARIVWRLYIRWVFDWQLDLLDHTQLHTITVYTLLQLTTVHYNTCRVVTSFLSSNTTGSVRLQLFSEDCCSARLLTHWLQPLRSNTNWHGSHSKTELNYYWRSNANWLTGAPAPFI
jgi:hypothetical protein